MSLIIITGPQAVGKMTVGQELEKLTGLKLFHNHMTIDFVGQFFDYSTKEAQYLVGLYRTEMFKTVAKSDLSGLIFTYVWAFDQPNDHDFINHLKQIFQECNKSIYIVELETNFEERLKRNISSNRLHYKPSKRDTAFTEAQIRNTADNYRLNSFEGELDYENYLRVENTNTSASDVARCIKEHFQF